MSDTYPGASAPPPEETGQQGTPEYLEVGAGSPLPPDGQATRPSGRGRRRGILIGGGVAALAVVGVGAWAAAQFFATGAQPTEALPATTIAYAGIDLDPGGAQKIEAVRTLNKFPAFKDEFGLDASDDIRQQIFDKIDLPAGCHLFYDQDIKPWLGDRMAVAAVDTGAKDLAVVGVIQVKDHDAADKALTMLRGCGDGPPSGGWVFDGDWVIVGEDAGVAQAVSAAADKGTLADDKDFQALTSAAGDPGIVSLYTSPAAGKYLNQDGDVAGLADGITEGLTGGEVDLGSSSDSPDSQPPSGEGLADFGGMAVTVRFDDGALEVESAGSYGAGFDALYGTDRGADVVETLPADTAAAIGAGFDEGWLTRVAGEIASYTGSNMTPQQLLAEASHMTGLDLPKDAETLLGRSAALSLGSDFDLEAYLNSGGGDIPVALKVQGDAEAARTVLDKIVAQEPDAQQFLGIDSDGGVFVVGPDADYRKAVIGKGSLGDDEVYRDVIRESDKAGAVLYVNFNAGDDWLVRAAGDSDPSITDNLRPLAGFGIDSWQDDNWTHAVLRLTTD